MNKDPQDTHPKCPRPAPIDSLMPTDYGALTISSVILNLIPVTVGNVIGGGVLVGAVYWFVYLRQR